MGYLRFSWIFLMIAALFSFERTCFFAFLKMNGLLDMFCLPSNLRKGDSFELDDEEEDELDDE